MRRALLATMLTALLLAPAPAASGAGGLRVKAVSPGVLAAGITAELTVEGKGFAPGATVSFVNADFSWMPASQAGAVLVDSPSRLRVVVSTSVPEGPSPNHEDVLVTNPDGAVAVMPRGLTVNPVPTFVHASPSALAQGTTVPVTVECSRCQPGTGASVSGDGVAVSGFEGAVPYRMTLLVAADAPVGPRQLTVATVDGGSVGAPVEVVARSEAADLTIAVAAGEFSAAGGGRFTVTVANAGPAPAPLVSFFAELPPGFSVSGSSGPLACGTGGRAVVCGPSATPLAAGTSLVQVVEVAVGAGAPRRAVVSFRASGDSSVAELSYADNQTVVPVATRSGSPGPPTTSPTTTSPTTTSPTTTSTTTTTAKPRKTTTTTAPSTTTTSTTTTSTTTATSVPPGGGPAITSFTPSGGPPGTRVVIFGSGFDGASAVTLGGSPVTVKSVWPTEIRVVTRPDNATGPFVVTVGPLTASSPEPFVVTGTGKAGPDGD